MLVESGAKRKANEMIEGVNASIANAPLVRPVVEQAEQVRSSYAANPKQVQQIPQAPYVSPYVAIDYTYDRAVLQFRDADSGEVVTQIPTDTQLRAYRRAQQVPESARPEQFSAPAKVPDIQVDAQSAPVARVESQGPPAATQATSVLVDA